MSDTTLARISSLTGDLAPLAKYALRYADLGSTVDGSAVVIAPMPWVAPLARAFWIYEPLAFELPADLACPDAYSSILRQMNGCFAFGLSLYGLPTSSGLISRSTLRPLSLALANLHWRRDFESADRLFHFGGATFSETENVGYFFSEDQIISIRKSGSEVQRWPNFSSFLGDELHRVETLANANPKAAETWHDRVGI
jgi:hypothetical protein